MPARAGPPSPYLREACCRPGGPPPGSRRRRLGWERVCGNAGAGGWGLRPGFRVALGALAGPPRPALSPRLRPRVRPASRGVCLNPGGLRSCVCVTQCFRPSHSGGAEGPGAARRPRRDPRALLKRRAKGLATWSADGNSKVRRSNLLVQGQAGINYVPDCPRPPPPKVRKGMSLSLSERSSLWSGTLSS